MSSGSHPEVEGDDCLIVELVPALRAFARTFVRSQDAADDLVQETLTKAIANIDKFRPGTRMKSWLFTIMRNTFCSEFQARRRERPLDFEDAAPLRIEAPQEWAARGREVQRAIERLSRSQREILVLIGVLGVSYEDAAAICDCPVGTVKSRLNRARAAILEQLGETSVDAAMQKEDVLSHQHFAAER